MSASPEQVRAAGKMRGYVVRHVVGGHLKMTSGATEWTNAGQPTIFADAAEAHARAMKTREWNGSRDTIPARFVVMPAFDGPGDPRFADVDMESHYREALSAIAALQPTIPRGYGIASASYDAGVSAGKYQAGQIAQGALDGAE